MQLQGKIVNFLGDSITEGAGMQGKMHLRYHQVIQRDCGLKTANVYGVGGTRFAYQTKPSPSPKWDLYFPGRAITMDTSADIVVVYGGVNDYIHGDAPFGQTGDTQPTTFCGAVRYLMEYLKNTYKGKPIVFMSPARCYYQGVSCLQVSPRECKHPDSKPLQAYVDVIKRTGEALSIPVLDLYDALGIDPSNAEDYQKYTVDGLHFNEFGHAVIAQKLKEFLLSL